MFLKINFWNFFNIIYLINLFLKNYILLFQYFICKIILKLKLLDLLHWPWRNNIFRIRCKGRSWGVYVGGACLRVVVGVWVGITPQSVRSSSVARGTYSDCGGVVGLGVGTLIQGVIWGSGTWAIAWSLGSGICWDLEKFYVSTLEKITKLCLLRPILNNRI